MEQKSWQLKFFGKQIWEGMLADLNTALVSIEVEQFSFFDDKIGRAFLELFERKLEQGVKVRVITDSLNSRPLVLSAYAKELEKKGLEIIYFNPPRLLSLNKIFFRTHKKILVIDSTIAWVGGLGVKNKYRTFRDTQVRLTGSVVSDILDGFEEMWRQLKSDPTKTEQLDKNMRRRNTDSQFQFLVNYGRFEKKEIYEWMREQIVNAKRSIYINSSYFYPDRNFFQLLLNKKREGVDVKIILRGMDDEYFPVRFSSSYFKIALTHGIEIYRYQPAIMHSKTMIIDDVATVGSCNLDKFSFYYNLEANIVSTDKFFVEELKLQFAKDLKYCKAVRLENWQNRRFSERLLELLIWPIHNYL